MTSLARKEDLADFKEVKKRSGKVWTKFAKEDVAAAIDAGRGINTWAADILSKMTGKSCTPQTIVNYMERWPELRDVAVSRKTRLLDKAEHNVARAIEAQDMETTRWFLRCSVAMERGYTTAPFRGQVDVDHSGEVTHKVVLDDMRARVLEEVGKHARVIEGKAKVVNE